MGVREKALIAAGLLLACAGGAHGQAVAGAAGCRAYAALAPADESVIRLLATPAVPPPTLVFAAQSARQLTEWDLPTKVAEWKDRPSSPELARKWEELNRSWYGAKPGDTTKSVPPAVYRPYELLRIGQRDWNDLEKWMAKETSKHGAGLCYDEERATYVFVAGAVRDPVAASSGGQTRTLMYAHNAGQAQPEGIGPGGHSATSTGHSAIGDEFDASSGSNDPSVYSCVYLYRTAGAAQGAKAMRQATPELYYCHAASGLRSSLSTMLKYLTKQGLP